MPIETHDAWWSRADVAIVSLCVSLGTSAAAFAIYVVIVKLLHGATYVPLLAGLVVVASAPMLVQSRRDTKHRTGAFKLVLASVLSALLYAFTVLLLILNVLGA
jgi:hypothetical protein